MSLKIRAVLDKSYEKYPTLVVIDDFDVLENKSTNRNKDYHCGTLIRSSIDSSKEHLCPQLFFEASLCDRINIKYVGGNRIHKADIFLKPSIKEYLLLGRALRCRKVIYNKKKEKFINLNKEKQEVI